MTACENCLKLQSITFKGAPNSSAFFVCSSVQYIVKSSILSKIYMPKEL